MRRLDDAVSPLLHLPSAELRIPLQLRGRPRRNQEEEVQEPVSTQKLNPFVDFLWMFFKFNRLLTWEKLVCFYVPECEFSEIMMLMTLEKLSG